MKHRILPAIILVCALAGCSRFDEMSKNPYALYEAPAESFVHPIMFKTQYNLISVFRGTTVFLAQYAVTTNAESSSRIIGNYNIPEGTSDDIWTSLYLQYGNAMVMYDQAVREGSKSMQAVALILRSFLITQITDSYGDVPFTEAGLLPLSGTTDKYTTAYDSQKEIYRAVFCMLEDANKMLSETEDIHFSALCDKTFGGDLDKWRRFGNSLYARLLMRVAMKVMEEDGGTLELNDTWEALNVKSKLAEFYDCFQNGSGDYPMMRSRDDRPLIPFSTQNETEQTPFYTTTNGIWNSVAVCDVLTRRMLDYTEAVDSDGQKYYKYKARESGGHVEDPRFDCWWRKTNGMPNQLLNADSVKFLDNEEHKSSAGNSLIGRMTYGNDYASAITGKIYDLKNASSYPLMNFSELYFIFAEAGARGLVSSASGIGAYLALLREGVTQSILEWNPYVTAESDEVVDYVNYVTNGELYSGATLNSDNALEAILTQKWISSFFIGIEAWSDYRRTGYPILRTDGPAAGNDKILPTRLRYPSDEPYRNPVSYQAAVDGWLGGTNNIQTDVWWADTKESKAVRLLGRK
ncbi:MAG: SusD/RagB family nutrient-binding outer membrane lipoprotein [Bacteroidales bacterium]|nr:SusD/RagB family nutrient-binding outer membrane lipoprotein [Bacteroidales bacterium]